MFSMVAIAQTSVTKVSKKDKTAINKSVMSETGATAASSESFSFKENEFDFGKIPQGKPVTHVFEFVNTGKKPFVLDKVQASCGCTTPEWNKDTVAVGATAFINVGFNAATEGPFIKSITITYNGDQTKQIIIKGEVWKTPATSAPINNSLKSLQTEQ